MLLLPWEARGPGERLCALCPCTSIYTHPEAWGSRLSREARPRRGQGSPSFRSEDEPTQLGGPRLCSPHRAWRPGRNSGVTFDGSTAHQVSEGQVQGPFRGEVGLSQGPHTLAHFQEQLSTLSAHSPSPGQLWAAGGRTRKEGGNGRVNAEPLSGQLRPSAPAAPSSGSSDNPSSIPGRELKASQAWTAPPSEKPRPWRQPPVGPPSRPEPQTRAWVPLGSPVPPSAP